MNWTPSKFKTSALHVKTSFCGLPFSFILIKYLEVSLLGHKGECRFYCVRNCQIVLQLGPFYIPTKSLELSFRYSMPLSALSILHLILVILVGLKWQLTCGFHYQ